MRLTLQVLLAASILLTALSVLDLGPPYRNANPQVAWLLAAWGWITVALETLLLLALFRVHVSPWVAVVVLLVQDGIWVWRLVVQRRARRKRRAERTDA